MFENVTQYFTRSDLVMFFVSFCVGVLFVCLVESKPEVIVRWPTPDNAGLVTYVDRSNNCYEYEPKEVGCTDDAKHIPVQTGEGMEVIQTDGPTIDRRPQPRKHRRVEEETWDKSFI